MGTPDSETVGFGERPAEEPAAGTAGYAEHRPGYVEAPSQVAGAEAGEEGAVRPQFLELPEEG